MSEDPDGLACFNNSKNEKEDTEHMKNNCQLNEDLTDSSFGNQDAEGKDRHDSLGSISIEEFWSNNGENEEVEQYETFDIRDDFEAVENNEKNVLEETNDDGKLSNTLEKNYETEVIDLSSDSEDEYVEVEQSEEDSEEYDEDQPSTSEKKKKQKTKRLKDDNIIENYNARLSKLNVRNKVKPDSIDLNDKWKIDSVIWNQLFEHQKEGVKWLQKKYDAGLGGILADEMGLGKTVQTSVFLRSVQESQISIKTLNAYGLGRTLLLCPASIIAQWITELNKWFPSCRIFVLHSTSSTSSRDKDVLKQLNKNKNSGNYQNGCILITTYKTFLQKSKMLNMLVWHFIILDEGHKIKNSKAKISSEVTKIQSPFRIVLSGTPIQNNLTELWNLINFIYPGKLGEYLQFKERYILPIESGSYLNSSDQNKEIAYECSLLLQEAVKPYILRRVKDDVKNDLHLPEKTEQILFCKLSKRQRKIYEAYLKSDQVQLIFAGKMDAFVGFSRLYAVCNHPGIYEKLECNDPLFGKIEDSGKLSVVMKLLKKWKKSGGNKVLFYTQKKAVISMMEHFLTIKGYAFLKMTGETPVGSRQSLIQDFSVDPNIYVFLLTTRVGGVGLNLTSANKVLIYDPDWNPTVDNQAKERAWRIGQTSNVSIYRLISAGTIEEKTYIRQIHKESLALKVLDNSSAKEIMPKETLRDLFRLVPEGVKGTEAGIYLDGETVPTEKRPSSKTAEKEDGLSSKKKIKRSDLSAFEDKKTLCHLFEGNMLHSILSHENAVQNEQKKMILRINAREHATRAARILIHSEGRSTKDWENKFLAKLPKSERRAELTNDSSSKNSEPVKSVWSTINKNIVENSGEKEMDDKVKLAMNLRYYFLLNKQNVTNDLIEKRFTPSKLTGLDAYFFREILLTIAKFNVEKNVWTLRSKYR